MTFLGLCTSIAAVPTAMYALPRIWAGIVCCCQSVVRIHGGAMTLMRIETTIADIYARMNQQDKRFDGQDTVLKEIREDVRAIAQERLQRTPPLRMAAEEQA